LEDLHPRFSPPVIDGQGSGVFLPGPAGMSKP